MAPAPVMATLSPGLMPPRFATCSAIDAGSMTAPSSKETLSGSLKIAFTPWTMLDDYLEMLEFVESNDIIDHVDPVQFSIRLLIPPGSWLAKLPEAKAHLGKLDEAAFTYRWEHPDPKMDQLQKQVAALVEEDAANDVDPSATFFRIKEVAQGQKPAVPIFSLPLDRERAPRMTESWFC